jgi:16S rRNA (cytosine1402-N4)-methyltransferase
MPLAPLALVGRAQRAGDAELADNPRARSATLRVAERTASPLGERELRDIGRRLGVRPWQS